MWCLVVGGGDGLFDNNYCVTPGLFFWESEYECWDWPGAWQGLVSKFSSWADIKNVKMSLI